MTTATNTTVQDEATALLAATPTRELLTKAYALTHQMHVLRPGRDRLASDQRLATLRAMRDLIDAELERRTGGV